MRATAELEQIIWNCPFSKEEVAEAESSSYAVCQYVALLTHAPLQEMIENLNACQNESEQYQIIEREVFLLFHHSIRNSKLANNLYKLGVSAAVRNWKTINKLTALDKTIE